MDTSGSSLISPPENKATLLNSDLLSPNAEYRYESKIVFSDHYMMPMNRMYESLHDVYMKYIKNKHKEEMLIMVPVIRIYGLIGNSLLRINEDDEKSMFASSCIHIHGVLPYLFLKVDDVGISLSSIDQGVVDSLKQQIESELSQKRNSKDRVQQRLAEVILCHDKTDCWGYTPKDYNKIFFKIILFNPNDIRRVQEGCNDNNIQLKIRDGRSSTLFPYEAHFSYLTKFFCDYQLSYFSNIVFNEVKNWRTKPDDPLLNRNPPANRHNVDFADLRAQTVSQFEVDVSIEDLMLKKEEISSGGDFQYVPTLMKIIRKDQEFRDAAGWDPYKVEFISREDNLNPELVNCFPSLAPDSNAPNRFGLINKYNEEVQKHKEKMIKKEENETEKFVMEGREGIVNFSNSIEKMNRLSSNDSNQNFLSGSPLSFSQLNQRSSLDSQIVNTKTETKDLFHFTPSQNSENDNTANLINSLRKNNERKEKCEMDKYHDIYLGSSQFSQEKMDLDYDSQLELDDRIRDGFDPDLISEELKELEAEEENFAEYVQFSQEHKRENTFFAFENNLSKITEEGSLNTTSEHKHIVEGKETDEEEEEINNEQKEMEAKSVFVNEVRDKSEVELDNMEEEGEEEVDVSVISIAYEGKKEVMHRWEELEFESVERREMDNERESSASKKRKQGFFLRELLQPIKNNHDNVSTSCFILTPEINPPSHRELQNSVNKVPTVVRPRFISTSDNNTNFKLVAEILIGCKKGDCFSSDLLLLPPEVLVQEYQTEGVRYFKRVLTPCLFPPPPGLLTLSKSSEDVNFYKKLIEAPVKDRLNGRFIDHSQVQKPESTQDKKGDSALGTGFVHHTKSEEEITSTLIMMSIEIIAVTRKDEKIEYLNDFEKDEIMAIVYMIKVGNKAERELRGVIMNRNYILDNVNLHVHRCVIKLCDSELELIDAFISLVQEKNVDLLLGYETVRGSLGYMRDRFNYLSALVDREKEEKEEEKGENSFDKENLFCSLLGKVKVGHPLNIPNLQGPEGWDAMQGSGIAISGRYIFSIWRILHNEMKLASYSFQNVYEHVIKEKFPLHSNHTVSVWLCSNDSFLQHKALSHVLNKVCGNFKIVDKMDIFLRHAEMCQLFGADLYSVFLRGSQYRVESIMRRITWPLNILLASPTRNQVQLQSPIEAQPLVMEPKTKIYYDPVAVIDFTALYPSVVIAYNLCYSTYIGQFYNSNERSINKFGPLPYRVKLHEVEEDVIKKAFVTPNGAIFASGKDCQGFLPKMLDEILRARARIKCTLKLAEKKGDAVLCRILDAWQVALKMVANVTYGYTAASYSGRMPSVQLADAIVSMARSCTQKSINHINENFELYGGKVVYGDTDSIFILMEGKTVEEAHAIGRLICKAISLFFPYPMSMKFEYVFHQCLLQTKKKYCGLKTEYIGDILHFLAKGDETVRKDYDNSTKKIVEAALRIAFTTGDINKVKAFVIRQWSNMLANKVDPKDFEYFANLRVKEYKNETFGLRILNEWKEVDRIYRLFGHLHKETVPYIMVNRNGKDSKIIDYVVSPREYLLNSSYTINVVYYILKKHIPSLSRIFNTFIDINIENWFKEMKRPRQRITRGLVKNMGTLDNLMPPCCMCFSGGNDLHNINGKRAKNGDKYVFCRICLKNLPAMLFTSLQQSNSIENEYIKIKNRCLWCTKSGISLKESGDFMKDSINCLNVECSTLFKRLVLKERYEWYHARSKILIENLINEED